jgi:hypothetical protein
MHRLKKWLNHIIKMLDGINISLRKLWLLEAKELS